MSPGHVDLVLFLRRPHGPSGRWADCVLRVIRVYVRTCVRAYVLKRKVPCPPPSSSLPNLSSPGGGSGSRWTRKQTLSCKVFIAELLFQNDDPGRFAGPLQEASPAYVNPHPVLRVLGIIILKADLACFWPQDEAPCRERPLSDHCALRMRQHLDELFQRALASEDVLRHLEPRDAHQAVGLVVQVVIVVYGLLVGPRGTLLFTLFNVARLVPRDSAVFWTSGRWPPKPRWGPKPLWEPKPFSSSAIVGVMGNGGGKNRTSPCNR